MTVLDALVLVLVVGGAIRGWMRGFTYEVMTLLSWIIGVIALRMFHPFVAIVLRDSVGTGDGSSLIAFALVFATFFYGSRIIGRRMGIGVRESFVGWFDRILGVGFGALKGLIAVTLIFLLANLASDVVYGGGSERPDWMRDSRTFPLLNASGRAIIDFVEARQADGTIPDQADRNE